MSDQVLGALGGGLLDADAPVLRADDLGVLRGDGVFETVLVRDSHPIDIERHLDRLAISAEATDLPAPDRPAWRELVGQVAAAWQGGREAMLRLIYTRGSPDPDGTDRPTGYALALPIPESTLRARREGISVVTLTRGTASDMHVGAPWLLAGAKTLSYAVNMAAQRHAQSLGADDVVFVGTDGLVLEGPTAAVVWATGDTLHTVSPAEACILASITVRRLFDNAGRYGFTTTSPAAPSPICTPRTACGWCRQCAAPRPCTPSTGRSAGTVT